MHNSFVDLNYELWWLLYQTRDAIFRARAKELIAYGISPMQSGVLFVVSTLGDEATPSKISQWMFRQPHSVTGLLNRMERAGLITREIDSYRKHQSRITLTEKGRSIYSQSGKKESINQIMSCLSEEQYQQFRSYLEMVQSEALKQLSTNLRPPFPQSR